MGWGGGSCSLLWNHDVSHFEHCLKRESRIRDSRRCLRLGSSSSPSFSWSSIPATQSRTLGHRLRPRKVPEKIINTSPRADDDDPFLRFVVRGFRFFGVFCVSCSVGKRLAFLKKLDFSKNWILLKIRYHRHTDVEQELAAGTPQIWG